jgi:hypothetical protein
VTNTVWDQLLGGLAVTAVLYIAYVVHAWKNRRR